MKCMWCEEPIVPGDRYETRGPCAAGFLYVHRECGARSVLGSVGHLKGKCTCFGGTEDDPPGMTKREAAKAALALWLQQSKL
jgi:hypothetical protein